MKGFKLFLFTIMSIVLVACGGGKDDPAVVAEDFAEAMIDADTDTVMDLMYISPEMQEDIDNDPNAEEMFESKLTAMMLQAKSEIEKEGGVEAIETGEVQYNSDVTRATVPVTMTRKKDGKSDTNNLKLVKTDDGWKVKM